MAKALSRTLNLFQLNKIDRDLFTWTGESVGLKRIFGGQIMAQCLIAGYQTVAKGRMAHSFHSYFLRPGDFKQDIIFEVDRIRDGKSFTTRRVNAVQNGEAIFTSSISFQKREKGLSHQIKMNDIAGPEGLESEWEIRSKMKSQIPKEYLPMWLREREIEMRQVASRYFYRAVFFGVLKDPGTLPAAFLSLVREALLLYVSDMGLLGTAVNPHGMNFMSKKFQGASLDHAMWFHSKINFNNWLLYQIESPVSSHARGFSRGSIYTKSGKLIASTSQEGLMRVWD
ncbi:acyl-CoA thioesterase II [Gammaproteobacteria bacterium]|nr:acyl-CoA thioesterase II [Gammaproteobacteria bacterium]